MENLPTRGTLLRMDGAMVGLSCATFGQVPKRIVLNIIVTLHRDERLRQPHA